MDPIVSTKLSLNPKTALITGITGQDGSYLAEFLIEKGYVVHGIIRKCSTFNTDRIEHLYQDPHEEKRKLILHYGDMTDSTSLISIIAKVRPSEIYNLAAQRFFFFKIFNIIFPFFKNKTFFCWNF